METKDWSGNSNSIWKTMGASNHTEKERQNEDYYATSPEAAEWLLKIENIDKNKPIWECSSDCDHLANVFKKHGYEVRTSDLVKRLETTEELDFLKQNEIWNGTIITNPPYKMAKEFVYKAMETVTDGNKVCMFLKLQFLEGKGIRKLFKEYPPKTIWVSSSRLMCAKNGDFETMIQGGGSSVSYMFMVFTPNNKDLPIIDWI